MPQMSPLLWLPLFMLFSIMMSMVMMKVYFTSSKKEKETSIKAINISSSLTNWKW